MSLYLTCTLFALMILVYWIISELFTTLFRFTGLPEERARFQVVSLLTGCGFTTRESEMLLSTRRRRRLARGTMLFGYIFNITIVSTFVNVFLTLKLNQLEHTFAALLLPLLAILAVYAVARVHSVRAWCEARIEKLALRVLRQEASNTVMLLDYIGLDSIALVNLRQVPESLAGKELKDTGLRAERNLLVMLVERAGEKAVPAGADTVFCPGDKLTVFGRFEEICRAFEARENFNED